MLHQFIFIYHVQPFLLRPVATPRASKNISSNGLFANDSIASDFGTQTHLEEPLLVVAIPDIDNTIPSTSSKSALYGVVCDGVYRVHYINAILIPPVTLW